MAWVFSIYSKYPEFVWLPRPKWFKPEMTRHIPGATEVIKQFFYFDLHGDLTLIKCRDFKVLNEPTKNPIYLVHNGLPLVNRNILECSHSIINTPDVYLEQLDVVISVGWNVLNDQQLYDTVSNRAVRREDVVKVGQELLCQWFYLRYGRG